MSVDVNIMNIRKFLKDNILNANSFVGHQNERQQVFELLERTIKSGESNSALLLGPKGAGKTTLVNDCLKELTPLFKTDAILVKLNGLIHTDDRLAIRSISLQMELENAVDGKVFGSFADNLSFLLECLKSGEKEVSKCVIFIIEEFDLFCFHHHQTLLYNLFDVSQSAQTPICVLGITCRLDVLELLEKRVKSRFSHRQILLFLGKDEDEKKSELDYRLERLRQFLLIPKTTKLAFSATFRKEWNAHIEDLLEKSNFRNLMERLLDVDLSERVMKNILMMVVSELDNENNQLTFEAFQKQIQHYEKDDIISVLQDLNILELALVITMKHHYDIYDNQPMNFEMVYNRYLKFANANSNLQSVQRAVVLKAFEHVQDLELVSVLHSGGNAVRKEYELFKLLVSPHQIVEAVKTTPRLPSEILQYVNSSFV